MRIEKKFAADDAARDAAHNAAGTWNVMFKLAVAKLVAEGKVERSGEGPISMDELFHIRGPAS